MKSFLLFLFLALFCAVPSFAQRTISPSSQAYAQQAQMMREIQYSIQALSERMGALEQQNAALASRISALERGGNAATKDDLAALRADLAAVKNDQGKIREEIIADLTGKIKTLADKQRAEAAAAEKAAAKAAQKSGYKHTVEAGQTISAIAQAYKVTPASILKANKIKDPTKIRVGQVLFIPDP